MVIKEILHTKDTSTLIFDILGNEYTMECVHKNRKNYIVITNNANGKVLTSSQLIDLNRAYSVCMNDLDYIPAQVVMIRLLIILKGFNLGDKVALSSENEAIFLDFMSDLLGYNVKLVYEYNLYEEKISLSEAKDIKFKSRKNYKMTIYSNKTLMLTKDTGLLLEDNVSGNLYKCEIDTDVDAYIIMKYSLAGEEVNHKEVLLQLGKFIYALEEYNK